jgi:hypothetical protein
LVVLYPNSQSLFVDARLRDRLRHRFPRWFRERESVLGAQPGAGAAAWREPLLRWGERRGIPLLDLWPRFLERSDWPDLYQAGDIHLSSAGCNLVAQSLATALADHPRALWQPERLTN